MILSFSVLLASSASHKVQAREVFRGQIAAYGLLPGFLSSPAALVLPILELALAAALLIPFMTSMALYGTAALLGFYALVMKTALILGRGAIDCGCSSTLASTPLSNAMVARNIVLGALCIAATLSFEPRALTLFDKGLAILVGMTFWVFYNGANQLMANGPELKSLRSA